MNKEILFIYPDKKQIITSLRRGFRWGLLTFAHIKSKKKAISERIP